MTTMPPEMSSAATPTVALPPSSAHSTRDTLSSLSQASRSRFMITDILAGSAAAAAAAMQNGRVNSPSGNTNNNTNNNNGHHQHLQQQQHHHQHQQQQQHQAALQHYLAQQQHLLQQHHHQQQQQQQQQQHFPHHQQSPLAAGHAHPLSHLSPAALIGFPPGSGAAAHPNGLHAAQAAAHYAALQQERERLRDLDSSSSVGGGGGGSGLLDHDDRSRSPPLPHSIGAGGGGGVGIGGARDLSGSLLQNISGGGGSSSISGDQASTIDDSDSDTCAKDDDGNSSKSDNLMGLSKKQRKARTAFTDHQLQTLEKSFERQKYLSVQDRMELANKLELSDCQVKTWYQNRRTKWKRQTAVGLELLAEAGNYAAFQRLYGGSPYLSAWPYAAQSPHGAPPSAIDLYYRQAAAAAALQKPLSYRMYPSVPPMGGLPGMPVAPSPMAHLSASNSLSSLSSYYQAAGGGGAQSLNNNNNIINNNNTLPPTHAHSPVQSDEVSEKQRNSVELPRTPSPQLNPGSPPERSAENNSSCPPPSDEEVIDDDDDEDAIEV